MTLKYSDETRYILSMARNMASMMHHHVLCPGHLILSILQEPNNDAYQYFSGAGVDIKELEKKAMEHQPEQREYALMALEIPFLPAENLLLKKELNWQKRQD